MEFYIAQGISVLTAPAFVRFCAKKQNKRKRYPPLTNPTAYCIIRASSFCRASREKEVKYVPHRY